jgi:hypothetical protein
MMISVRRAKAGTGLALQVPARESGAGDYEQTIHPGESALGFTYEEWDVAVGPQQECRIEVDEEGALRPVIDGPDPT